MSDKKQSLVFHEVAKLLPDPTEEEYQALKQSIKDIGQQVKIPLYKGVAIDGRSRDRACSELGIEPTTEEVEITGSPVGYVLALNAHRRHLSSSQKAAVAVKADTLLAKEAAARQRTGKSSDGKAGGRGRKKNLPQKVGEGKSDKHAGEADEQLARAAGTNRQYVADARAIQAKNPKVLDEVLEGRKSLAEAKREVLASATTEKTPAAARSNAANEAKDLQDAIDGVERILSRNLGLAKETVPSLAPAQKKAITEKLNRIRDLVDQMLRVGSEEEE
jgi:hypothetical protein